MDSQVCTDQIVARRNLEQLRKQPYPGRGIVVGLDQAGKSLIQMYWIMGRSENSRNRIFASEGGRVFTKAADPAKVKDPKLIIYNAMDSGNGFFVVNNGRQTDWVLDELILGKKFSDAIDVFDYEPDSPNFTPRIMAMSKMSKMSKMPNVTFVILRKSRWGNSCDRSSYVFHEIGWGLGFCVTTYSGEDVADGEPLPSFQGEPYLLPLEGDASQIAETFWAALDESNRVSLVVKQIDLATKQSTVKIINKYEGV